MDRSSLAASLNGGYITEYDFDLRRNLLALQVEVLDSGILSRYNVRFEQLSHFSLESESIRDKDRLELTEIWIDSTPEASSSEEWELTISMWDITHIQLRCAVVNVDGVSLK